MEEIEAYCRERGVTGGYVSTSALTGHGLAELRSRIQEQVPWERLTSTVTTEAFKRIKEFTLQLKERNVDTLSMQVLGRAIEADLGHTFDQNQLTTAVGHLAKHGYVQILRSAGGERTVLLRPELLNSLASSIVLEARRNPRGLGAVDEAQLLGDMYNFAELRGLPVKERAILLEAAVVLFLEHNLCFREMVGTQAFLIFPELMNRKRPPNSGGEVLIDDVSYSVTGAVTNVYAALVVLLGYTNTFTRADQWQGMAQYEVGEGETCGFRQVAEREGQIELVLSYGQGTSAPTRLIFQGLFERILAGRQVEVLRTSPIDCSECHYRQERAEIIRRSTEGKNLIFCSNCGARSDIPERSTLSLSAGTKSAIDRDAAAATRRTGYEAALAQLKSYRRTWDEPSKRVFVSYAWGDPTHESWVERRLGRDLRQAGIEVVLDRWENSQPGSNVARFVSRIAECDVVVVVGTPMYRRKYENRLSTTGTVVAAEVDLISQRLLGTEEEKRTVLPLLLDGSDRESLPPLLVGRVFSDFRSEFNYSRSLFDLVLTIEGVRFDDEAVVDLRDALKDDALGASAVGE